MITVPKMLQIPDKLLPIISEFNDWRYFLLEGGRGGGKTQGVARLLLYIAEQKAIRIFCGREIQNTIEESVYTVFRDIIQEYSLNFEVYSSKIIHRETKSEIRFKGFREQGMINIKGLEGVDILWIDEAQAITKPTLDVILPTIRKDRARVFFTMNRYLRNDAVYKQFIDRDDCKHIKINFIDNPFCTQALKAEAAQCHPDDYNHIWLGEPLADADNYLFNTAELNGAKKAEFHYDPTLWGNKIMGQDIARYGDDYSVATIITQRGPHQWEQTLKIKWKGKDLMETTGRVTDIILMEKPGIVVIDGDGMGAGVVDRLREMKREIKEFRGGTIENIDTKRYKNLKAMSYYKVKDILTRGWLRINEDSIIEQLETIKFEYSSTGQKSIVSKEKMRRDNVKSPDEADALMMAISECDNIHRVQRNIYHRQPRYAKEVNII